MTESFTVLCHNQGQVEALGFTLAFLPDTKLTKIIKKQGNSILLIYRESEKKRRKNWQKTFW